MEVTVLEKGVVNAGSSWGNAGWIAPALTLPLPEPGIFSYGLQAVFSPSSPVYVPFSLNPKLLRFLAGFAWYSTPAKWRKNMAIFAEINKWGVESFERLEAGGVEEKMITAEPFLTGFVNEKNVGVLEHEFAEITKRGGSVDFERITGDELRAIEPTISQNVTHGIRIEGQHYINPPSWVDSLAASVTERGGKIVTGMDVTDVTDLGVDGVDVITASGESVRADQVVLATGTWLGELARKFGVRQVVQAGRGYSFSVKPKVIPTHPIYFPVERVACTPLGDRLRIGGMMEFRPAGADPDPRRLSTMIDAARPLFDDVDWDAREEEWVGSRPCTPDGLPLVGVTKSPRVHVAGGHGMWGVTLGPFTGRIVADSMTGNGRHDLLTVFNPLR